MGMDKALKMTLLAEVYDAAEAERLGLVTQVVPHDQLEAKTLGFSPARSQDKRRSRRRWRST